MLNRLILRRGTAVSVGRLFTTSVPRWKDPPSVEGTFSGGVFTTPLNADAIKVQLKTEPIVAPNAERAAAVQAAKELAVTISWLLAMVVVPILPIAILRYFMRKLEPSKGFEKKLTSTYK